MNQVADEDLMYQFQKGQRDACAELYERYKRILLAYFYNNTYSRSLSEDLLQITFEKVLRQGIKSKKVEKFKPWIFSIARNVYIDYFKQKKRSKESEWDRFDDAKISIERNQIEKENEKQQELLHTAMKKLSADSRSLISMVKLNGIRYQDAAEILQTTEANIKVKVFRIMQELKGIMQELTND